MKIVVFVVIIILFGLIGFEIKRKYIEQKNLLFFLRSFIDYLNINILLYKNDISEIINNYLIRQNNKNAKYNHLFQKNNILTQFNEKLIHDYIFDYDMKLSLIGYFNNLGNSDIENECAKAKSILVQIDNVIEKTNEDIKQRGDLWFKIWLALGVVVVIVLWWGYEYFNFI